MRGARCGGSRSRARPTAVEAPRDPAPRIRRRAAPRASGARSPTQSYPRSARHASSTRRGHGESRPSGSSQPRAQRIRALEAERRPDSQALAYERARLERAERAHGKRSASGSQARPAAAQSAATSRRPTPTFGRGGTSCAASLSAGEKLTSVTHFRAQVRIWSARSAPDPMSPALARRGSRAADRDRALPLRPPGRAGRARLATEPTTREAQLAHRRAQREIERANRRLGRELARTGGREL